MADEILRALETRVKSLAVLGTIAPAHAPIAV
jgi:hypothetical protein